MDQRRRTRVVASWRTGVFSAFYMVSSNSSACAAGCTLSSFLEDVVDVHVLDPGVIKTNTREQNTQLPDLECTL
jgi:hypothetical protein